MSKLHDVVEETIRTIRGIGELTVYDVSDRIGMHLGLETSMVHIHAGARSGARALGLDARRRRFALDEVPPELHRLGAAGIEDFLCIEKSRLRLSMLRQ